MVKRDKEDILVSIIMATYNEPSETISDSIESLIHQDYQHLEILIADDSTQAETIRTIDQFAERDKRIIVIRSEKRMGFVTALNTAMRKAKGELLARMDGDDISLPDRISKQVDYAKSNPEIDIFGGSMYIINEQGETISQRNYPITKWGIYKMFLFRSPFAHPTIMFRRSIIDGGIFYDSKYKKAEDIDFYMKLLKNGFHFGNLPDILLRYRIIGNLGKKRNKEQWHYNHMARKKFIFRKPIFSIVSYLISLSYIYIPPTIVSRYYKKENSRLQALARS